MFITYKQNQNTNKHKITMAAGYTGQTSARGGFPKIIEDYMTGVRSCNGDVEAASQAATNGQVEVADLATGNVSADANIPVALLHAGNNTLTLAGPASGAATAGGYKLLYCTERTASLAGFTGTTRTVSAGTFSTAVEPSFANADNVNRWILLSWDGTRWNAVGRSGTGIMA